MGKDHTLAAMKHYGARLDPETYLNYAFMGEPPDALDAEEEAELPEEFRLPEHDGDD